MIEVRVCGDGAALARRFAEPLSAGALEEPGSVRLCVADAEAAAAAQGGQLSLERAERGAAFVVRLPRSEGPR